MYLHKAGENEIFNLNILKKNLEATYMYSLT